MEQHENNDIEFFEEMYHLTYKLVYYIINRIVNSPHISEDLVQDTFLSAYRNLDSLSPKTQESFKAWIGVIAANKAKDYLKKMKPYLFTDVGSADFEYEPEDNRSELRPDQIAHTEELKVIVNEVMEGLPEDQRLVIMMYYYQQYSIKEISQLIKVNESTVKSKLNYAKSKIKVSFDTKSVSDYRYRSVSPFILFAAGLRIVPETLASQGGFIALTGLIGKSKTDDKKRSNRRKAGVGLVVTGLVFSMFNFLNPEKIKDTIDKPQEDNHEVNQKIDMFEYFDVGFSGNNGEGKLSVIIKQTQNESINKALNKIQLRYESGGLSNGSLVLVSIVNVNELEMEILSYEKYYVVQGLQ